MNPAHLQGLNPAQLEAVTTTEGPLLVLAGAGSGKTRVLTHRVAHLLHLGVPPWQVMAVTFTNKAANEMRQRVRELVGPAARDILVSTFHSACLRFLRRDAPLAGYEPGFTVYDDDDQLRLLKAVLRELGIDPKRHSPRWYRARIDRAKNRVLGPEEVLPSRAEPSSARFPEVYRRYQEALRERNAMDFGDLVAVMVRLLEGRPELRERYQRRFRYLLVDEYQDTNHAQYRLVHALTGPEENLMVVGDDDQSIYAFRGADLENILRFEADHPGARVVRLERNYRSTGNILRAANALVARNRRRKPKTLWTEDGDGPPVRVLAAEDPEDEARAVLRELRRLVAEEGLRPGDVAVITRTNAYTRELEEVLQAAGVPYALVGSRRFYERQEVRDLLAYLRLLAQPADDLALQRIVNRPSRGIGATTLARLRERARADGVPLLEAARRLAAPGNSRMARALGRFVELLDELSAELPATPLDALVLRVAERTGLLALYRAEGPEGQAREENLLALSRGARRLLEEQPGLSTLEALRAFLDRASLAGQDEELPERGGEGPGRVTVLTAHLAKGLEFPAVFVVGMVEGLFPHALSQEEETDVEEERRLAYVAMTRARRHLVLTYPRRRLLRAGQVMRWVPAQPSRFLSEAGLDRARLEARRRAAREAANERLRRFLAQHPRPSRAPPRSSGPAKAPGGVTTFIPDSPEAYQPGQRVRHPSLGDGVVEQRRGSPNDPLLFVRFGRRLVRLKPRVVPLEILLD